MPQLVGLVLIGAGVVAGYRLITRVLGGAAEKPVAAEASERVGEKDLGALVWDETAKVYRPGRH